MTVSPDITQRLVELGIFKHDQIMLHDLMQTEEWKKLGLRVYNVGDRWRMDWRVHHSGEYDYSVADVTDLRSVIDFIASLIAERKGKG